MATMAPKATELIGISRILALEEIALIVEEAKADGETLRVGYHAGMLAFSYPDSGMSIRRLCDELIFAASNAGVVAEMYRAGYGHGKKSVTARKSNQRTASAKAPRKPRRPKRSKRQTATWNDAGPGRES